MNTFFVAANGKTFTRIKVLTNVRGRGRWRKWKISVCKKGDEKSYNLPC